MTVVCALCGASLDTTDALSLAIRAAEGVVAATATQELFVHAKCLGSALDASVTFDADVFNEE